MKILLQQYKQLLSYDTANTLKIGDFFAQIVDFRRPQGQLVSRSQTLFSRRGVIAFSISAPLETRLGLASYMRDFCNSNMCSLYRSSYISSYVAVASYYSYGITINHYKSFTYNEIMYSKMCKIHCPYIKIVLNLNIFLISASYPAGGLAAISRLLAEFSCYLQSHFRSKNWPDWLFFGGYGPVYAQHQQRFQV